MTYQSLYRRYRPQRFGDVLGQDHVSATLRNAVRSETVAHAYLFSGPRGCGKTTSARILAKALNCTDVQDGEPCGACESCRLVTSGSSMDVSELDAASNNGVDAMRELVARAALGTSGRRKVYIVDEVHMLSTAASNALLKTLEEPPDHVVFVLATTDPQKVLPTIRSRTQHFEFRLFALDTLVGLVRDVAADAGLGIDEATILAVARKGNGSARDALSALDQVAAAGGIEDSFDVSELALALADREATGVLEAVDRAVERGRDPRQLTRDLLEVLREAFLVQMGLVRPAADAELVRRIGPAAVTRAIEQLGEALVIMRDALDPRITLEVALVRLVRSDLDTSPAALAERLELIERRLADGEAMAMARAAPVAPMVLTPMPSPRSLDPTAAPSSGIGDGAAAPVVPPSLATVPEPPVVPPTEAERVPDAPSLSALPSLRAPASAPDARPPATTARGGAADGARAVLGARPTTAALAGAAAAGLSSRLAVSASALAPASAPALPPLDFGAVTATALNEAKDAMLELLERKGKILLAAGRFLHADASEATFGLPNPMHLQRCLEWGAPWQAVVQAYTGASVAIRLVVEPQSDDLHAGAALTLSDGPAVDPANPGVVDFDPDDFDPDDLVDAPQTAIPTTLEHLTNAFPGAQVVEEGHAR